MEARTLRLKPVDYDPFSDRPAAGGRRSTPVDYDPFAVEEPSGGPVSEAQREIWHSVQMGEDANLAYNEAVSLRWNGAWSERHARRLEQAVGQLIDRHQALRMSFSESGDRFRLQPAAGAKFRLEERELDAEELENALTEEVRRPFALDRGPLFRMRLYHPRAGTHQHVLAFTAHHIVCDGWSMQILLKELGEIFSGRVRDLAEPDLFTDYIEQEARRMRADAGRDDLQFWVDKLSRPFESGSSLLDLPVDGVRSPGRTYAANRLDWDFDPELYRRLRRLGGRHGCSLVATLLAAFEVLMARLSGQHDFVVGLPAAGQSAAGRPRLAGHCVNLLPLRVRIDFKRGFGDLLEHVRGELLDAFDHQQVTLGQTLRALSERLKEERDSSRPAIAGVMFNVDRRLPSDQVELDGVKADLWTTPRPYENYELFVNAVEEPRGLTLLCQYHSELFEEDTVRAWMRSFEHLVRCLVEDPASPLGAHEIVSPEDRRRLLAERNATSAATRFCSLPDAVFSDLQDKHDRTAVVGEDGSLSYGELDRFCRRLAGRLSETGVQRGDLVGICMERGTSLPVGMLGIQRAGAGYVPLDPSYPAERLRFMIEDSGASVLLTQRALDPVVREIAPVDVRILEIEEVLDAAEHADDALRWEARHSAYADSPVAEDLAYLIYTSGSTGKPKGVQIEHRSAVNFIESMARLPGLGPDETLLAVTTISFDISVLEIYLPLLTGAAVRIVPQECVADGEELLGLLQRSAATAMQATPATWRLLLGAGWDGQGGRGPLKALCGGEALPRDLRDELVGLGVELWNMYGPTETTVWSTCGRMTAEEHVIDVGRPIANTSVYILGGALDGQRQVLPPGVPGDLYIGGAGLARGYRNRPELTAEKFSPERFHPECPVAEARMYATGDRARWLPDGRLQILGRTDDQVKLRGYRIELGEIEAVLNRHPGIRQAVAMVREDRPGDQRLVAYVVSQPAASAGDEEDWRAHLRGSVPEYMVPQHFVPLDRIPLTYNGKVDRKVLPRPDGMAAGVATGPLGEGRADAAAMPFPADSTEQAVLAIWKDVFGLPEVGPDETFFRLGGHSLLSIRILSRIRRDLGASLNLRDFFAAPTVRLLAARVREAGAEDRTLPAAAAPIERRADASKAPLSLMQQRVWYLENLNEGTAVFHLPSAFRLRGELDRADLVAALDRIVDRHDALRTVIDPDGEEGAQQRVLPRSARPAAGWVALPETDLSPLPSTQREQEVRRLLSAEAREPFDLARFPLFRARLLRLAEREHVLFWMPHHIVWDGWSFDVFLRELDLILNGRDTDVPALPIQYGDFCAWNQQRQAGGPDSESFERDRRYWLNRMAGELPDLDVPADFARPAQFSFRGAAEAFEMDADRVARLTEYARARGATLYMLMLSAYVLLLCRRSGRDDLLVGTPIQGRNRPELEDLIGFFVNTLVLRARVEPRMDFDGLLERIKQTTLEAFSHQDMPFELLVEELKPRRDLSRTPVYQAFFTYQDVSNRKTRIGPCEAEQINIHGASVPTDLSLWVKQSGSGLVGALDYSTDLFRAETARGLVGEYLDILASVAAESPAGDEADKHAAASDAASVRTAVDDAIVGSTGDSAGDAIGDSIDAAGAVEAVLNRTPGVAGARVRVREGLPDDRRIVAYYRPARGCKLTGTALRRLLAGTFEPSRLPQFYVEVDDLAEDALPPLYYPQPVVGGGDRMAPSPDRPLPDAPNEGADRRVETEQYLIDLWEDVLGRTGIGKRDQFFEAGGHSLLSMKVIARIRKDKGIRISPRLIVMYNLEQIAAELCEMLAQESAA